MPQLGQMCFCVSRIILIVLIAINIIFLAHSSQHNRHIGVSGASNQLLLGVCRP